MHKTELSSPAVVMRDAESKPSQIALPLFRFIDPRLSDEPKHIDEKDRPPSQSLRQSQTP
jgi:hypothetical protein